MSKHARLLGLLLVLALMVSILPVPAVSAQGVCGDAPPPRLVVNDDGLVTFTDGLPLNVRAEAGLNGALVGQFPEGTTFTVLEGPVCNDAINWWRVDSDALAGWIAEGVSGDYFVEPVTGTEQPVPDAGSSTPLPISPATVFATLDWEAFVGDNWYSDSPDPSAIELPPVYAGDMPGLPVDLNNVRFVEDANLNDAQLALLAQNGFVVVPGGFEQFDEAYRQGENWLTVPDDYDYTIPTEEQGIGHAFFVTTDSLLHNLHFIFDNMLTELEQLSFYDQVVTLTKASLQQAHNQAQRLVDTPLARPAYNAELYLAVGLELLAPGESTGIVTGNITQDVQPLVAAALAGEGQIPLPFMTDYKEDFSQYRPRGHYEGDEKLERYFRGMMWLSRITFRANNADDSRMALLLLQALRTAPEAVAGWQNLHDTLSFLIGPVDDLGPPEYAALADEIFGPNLLETLADDALLAQFQAQIATLPGPRINGLILAPVETGEELVEQSRGFRFMGQRFTFDGYIMQQLLSPYVGTMERPRILPLALDVPAAMGSGTAFGLLDAAGVTAFENYEAQIAALRTETSRLSEDEWLENIYGGWLWTLQPLWDRDPAPYPPLMNTDAWRLHDLHTGLASWTELKHDTVLYAKQPGGLGGGGPQLTSFGYVEPNPLVFARIATVAALTHEGLLARNLVDMQNMDASNQPIIAVMYELRSLAAQAAYFAETARKELAGEAITEDEYYSIMGYGNYLMGTLAMLTSGEEKPDPVALVTDVANDGVATVLQEAVGNVDYIYVVVPSTRGDYQIVRGGVFSYYEFTGNINQRMTDSEWRALVAAGDLPPRPDWISAFYAE